MSVAATSEPARKPGPPLAVSIVVLVVGFVVSAIGAIGTGVLFAQSIDGSVLELPTTTQRHLGTGDYNVYLRSGDFGALDVSVTAADGASVPVHPSGSSNTSITSGSDTYDAVDEFHVSSAGSYLITISSSAGGGRVIVARTFQSSLDKATSWLIVLGSGVPLAILGFVLLIVGIVRRDRAARVQRVAQAAAVGPILVPAGWYPDPGGVARYRWWDGARWTDHTS